MGFLDSLIKNTVRQAVRDTVGQATREAVRNVAEDAIRKATGLDAGSRNAYDGRAASGQAAGQTAGGTAPAARDAASAASGTDGGEGGHTVEYFRGILASEFGAYELREQVSPGELGGSGRPYDFGLYQGGRLAAVVPLAAHNRTGNAAWKNARAAAENAGVPFINFHLHMPNRRDFVIDRVRRLLG